MRRNSIQWKLPFAIGVLLVVAMGSMAVFAFVEVRRALLGGATARLSQVTRQVQDCSKRLLASAT